MNWLLISVLAVFLIGILVGALRGFVKIGVSLLATILTLVLVVFLNPYVSDAVIQFTPFDEMIEDACVEAFMPSFSLEDVDLSGTPLADYDVEGLSEIDLGALGLEMEDISALIGEIPKDTQIKLIEDSGLPTFLKDSLLENNNNEIYEQLGVTSFVEYVAAYVARTIITICTFVITFIFAWIIVRSFAAVADLFSHLPIIKSVNRIAGAAIGFVFALIFVWVGFLVITLLYTTGIGETCFAMINDSAILTLLYEKNVLLGFLI